MLGETHMRRKLPCLKVSHSHEIFNVMSSSSNFTIERGCIFHLYTLVFLVVSGFSQEE